MVTFFCKFDKLERDNLKYSIEWYQNDNRLKLEDLPADTFESNITEESIIQFQFKDTVINLADI